MFERSTESKKKLEFLSDNLKDISCHSSGVGHILLIEK